MTHTGTEDAQRFLRAIFEPGDVIDFRFVPQADVYAHAGSPEMVAILEGLRKTKTRCRPWFGINPRKAFGCSKSAGTLLARCVVADFDDTTPEDAAARIKESLLPQNPVAIVKTVTGVQYWWRLSEVEYDLPRWDAAQVSIAHTLGSDPAMKNADRLARLPTFKDQHADVFSELLYLNDDPQNRFDIDDFIVANTYAKEKGDVWLSNDPAATSLLAARSMGDRTRDFIENGKVALNQHGQPGSRRVAMYRAACDLAARGWNVDDATAILMKGMEQFTDIANEMQDNPRQIKRAFDLAQPVADPSRFDPLQGTAVIEVKPVSSVAAVEPSTVWLVESQTECERLGALVAPDGVTNDVGAIFPRKTVYAALADDALLRATQRLVGIGCRVRSVNPDKLTDAATAAAVDRIREGAQFAPLLPTMREQMNATLRDLKGTQGLACLGIPTPGFPTMSAKLFGWRGLILMGAAPGVGKTTLALAAGLDALRHDSKTAFVVFSAEMSREVLRERLLATLARVPDRLLSVGDVCEKEDPATGLHLSPDDLRRVNVARELLESFGNRLCILDRREIPRMNRDTGYALQNMVEQTLAASNTSRPFVVLDPFQGVPFDSVSGQEWRQDLERDRGLMDFLLQTQRNIGEKFPFVVVSETTKNTWNEGAKMNDLLGTGRLAYSADAVLTVQPFEMPSDLDEAGRSRWLDIDPEHEDDRIERKLLRVSMVKGRDKMRRGDTWFVFEPAFQTIREHSDQTTVRDLVAAEVVKKKRIVEAITARKNQKVGK